MTTALLCEERRDVGTQAFVRNPRVVATVQSDGRVVLVNFDARSTCTLDGEGLDIWYHLEPGCTVDGLVRSLRNGRPNLEDGLEVMQKVSSVLLELSENDMIFAS